MSESRSRIDSSRRRGNMQHHAIKKIHFGQPAPSGSDDMSAMGASAELERVILFLQELSV